KSSLSLSLLSNNRKQLGPPPSWTVPGQTLNRLRGLCVRRAKEAHQPSSWSARDHVAPADGLKDTSPPFWLSRVKTHVPKWENLLHAFRPSSQFFIHGSTDPENCRYLSTWMSIEPRQF